MNVKCMPVREMFHDDIQGYRILACELLSSDVKVKLNKYGNFTLSGTNLEDMQLDQEANIVIVPDSKSKYDGSYIMLGYQGIGFNEGKVEVDPAFELEILSRLMEKTQALNVNNAYPRFVHMVLNGQEEEIDYHNIHNVGKKRLPNYIDKVKRDCHSILFYPTCYENGIDSQEVIRKLASYYKTPEGLNRDLSTHPYAVYMDVAGYSFDKADKFVTAHYPDMLKSRERCERAVTKILAGNEETGDTRLFVRVLLEELKDLVPETKEHMKEAIVDNPFVFYDEEKQCASLMSTYNAERTIAEHIKHRLIDKQIAPAMKWQDYTEVDGFTCTEEQSKILQLVANGARIALLTGSAGCVDCDTEFFTGYGWKRIADYTKGDKVLQYNKNGTAELVDPIQYVKKPCNNLWHFENSVLNQSLSDEHRVIYFDYKNRIKEMPANALIKNHEKNIKGFRGKFKTAFLYSGKGIELNDDEIRLMVAIFADGYFHKETTTKRCKLSFKKNRKINRAEKILIDCKIEYKKTTNNGYTHFYFNAPRREKEFTEYWYNCSNHQLRVIVDEYKYWDNSKEKYVTTIKRNAEFMQFAISSCGFRSNIYIDRRPNYKDCYYVSKTKSEFTTLTNSVEKTQIVQVPTTDGYKYCFTVPSSMLVLRRKNCIFVTGNCGKTASAKALIKMLDSVGATYQLLAPTGISSKRLREATNRPTSTIHMALTMGIRRTDYVILEESSMISVQLLATLLNGVGYEPNLIFICDEAQLASISCGNIVQDIIDSNIVPRANLTKVFRYGSSGLSTIATDTRNGTTEHLFDKYDDFKCVESDDTMEQILMEYENLMSQGYKKNDILILSPYNKGTKGTYVINQRIQKEFNTHDYTPIKYKHPLGEIRFKVGDKVLNTKNNYNMPCICYDDNGEEYEDTMFCANGDIGVVRDCRKIDDSRNALIVEFDNGLAIVAGKDVNHLILGYAVSCHKAQGLGYKAVLVIIAHQHKRMLSRNLCYVALSRAQECMVLISDQGTIDEALRVQENLERDTYLADLLKENNDD